jgi:outer membrane lipoprotein SlyB
LDLQQTKDRKVPQRLGPAASFALALGLCCGIAGCGPNYSPNTYGSNAVQQANKVDQAVVVGVRQVDISVQANVGALAGGGVGGIAGSQAGDTLGIGSALGALGGSVLGGIVGSTVEHQASDTQGYEYIVRKANGELVSVTQKDATPLAIGTHVLIIAGNQARIVPDYTVTLDGDKPPAKGAENTAPEAKPPVAATAPQPAPASAPEAAPAAAHIAITETPLATDAAPAPTAEAPPAPAAEAPKAEPPEVGQDSPLP